MPTLQFKGRNTIWNHHLSVPYHALEEVRELDYEPQKGDGNLIVEGDNLLALKALLPQYAGKVKCIYIDPPYNTGNEGWAYNDKVNSPMIRDWLGRTVDKDDLTRHDKWLCMMVPRLKLLRELLRDDGVIFISIDDNEVHNLRAIMNEIFGEDQMDCMIWRKSGDGRDGKMKNTTTFRKDHEYLILSFRNQKTLKKSLEKPNWENSYPNPDNDPRGNYKAGSISRKEDASDENHRNYYTVVSPSGEKFTRQFEVSQEEFEKLDGDNRIYWGKNSDAVPAIKIFEDEERAINTSSLILKKGTSTEGKKEIEELFANIDAFSNPKPTTLIRKIIQISTEKDDLILDSFSGSGTTMHAVMALNKEDGGSRKCIMVQMTEGTEKEPEKNICRDITRERVKRAIEKYDFESGFKYLRVGASMDAEDMLAGQLPSYEQLAKYVFYLATGTYLEEPTLNRRIHYVGANSSYAVYLIYEPDIDKLTQMALTLEIAEDIIAHNPKKRKIIYAPACFLDEEYMEEKKVDFVSVPYNLFKYKTV